MTTTLRESINKEVGEPIREWAGAEGSHLTPRNSLIMMLQKALLTLLVTAALP